MRVCIFSPDGEISTCDKKTVVDNLKTTLGQEEIEVTCLISYPWAKQVRPDGDVYSVDDAYFVPGFDGWKVRACRKLLKIIDQNRWIPPFLGFVALRLCDREIIEALLACDPDVIVCFNLQWRNQLKRLVRKRYPGWLCLTPTEPVPGIDRKWRRYDPSVKVSIILPTYNGAKYIRRSIESCLSQTHENLELIVVDDGSNEPSRKVLESYEDKRLRILRHEQNQGVAAALNTGFRNSTGEYLTWTSDDNYYAPSAIEEMIRFLQTYRWVDFVYAESYVIGENDQDQPWEVWRTEPPDWLKVDNGIGACFLYKREVYEAIGDYDSQMFLAEDYDYWVRVSKKFSMQRLFRPLYYYRRHAASLTAKYRPERVWEKVRLVKQINKVDA